MSATAERPAIEDVRPAVTEGGPSRGRRQAPEGPVKRKSPLARFGPVWRIYIALGLALTVAYFFAPKGLGHHLLYDGLGLSSVVAILYGVHKHQPKVRLPWYLFAAGELAFVAGDGIRAFYESVIGVEAPFPGYADAAYISAYPLLAAGLLLLVRSRDRAKDRANAIDATIVVTSFAVVAWVYLMRPYTQDPTISWLEIAISIAYPIGSLLLLAVAARLMVSPGVRPPAYYMLGASICALLVSDAFYTVGLLNETYHTGSLVDGGWLISYVLWGAAALHPSMTELSTPVSDGALRVTRRRLVLLASASLLAPAVRIIEEIRGNDVEVWVTVGGTIVLFGLVISRMSGLVQSLTSALLGHEAAERRRRESEERFGSLVQHASDVVTVIDRQGEITFQSPSVQRQFGYPRRRLMGHKLDELVHEDDREAVNTVLEDVTSRASDDPGSLTFRLRHANDDWRDVETTFTNLLDEPGVAGIVLNTRDVSEQTALQAQLSHQAFHDPLTDLANRALFRDRVEHALDRHTGGDDPIAVLFLDVDQFKTLNDSLGHSAGDQLLAELADRIRDCVRTGDTAARLGGDEFAILLEDTTDAHGVASRIGESLKTAFVIEGKEIYATVSIGISISEVARGGADELLRNADVAMYTAKSRGKACSAVFSPDMHRRVLRRLDLEAELRRAIERDEFRLHYQPLVSMADGSVTGFEALIRWAHPERGLVAPMEFIGVAEETGLIQPIGRWVLGEASRQARLWQIEYPERNLQMAVNLSAEELMGKDLVKEVSQTLSRSGLDPQSLVLEMTERVIMADTEVAIGRLAELRELGVQLAVDDFGTGFSSLSYLRNFPIDILKIAKPFLDGIPASDQETALVRGIVELGHKLELEVVAEGVERAEQWHALTEMGCDVVQGFLVARPQGPERIAKLLEGMRVAQASERARQEGQVSAERVLGFGPVVA